MDNHRKANVNDCVIYNLHKIQNRAGNITPVAGGIDMPFDIMRIYYLYDVPGGATRGGHAHKELQQFIVAASGSFDVILDDGFNKKVVSLNRPYYGLYIPRMIWREIIDFSSGAICLVLASAKYAESDYIRSYEDFKKLREGSDNANGIFQASHSLR